MKIYELSEFIKQAFPRTFIPHHTLTIGTIKQKWFSNCLNTTF